MLERRKWLFAIAALLPTLAIFAWVRIYPIAETLRLSLYKWDLISKNKPFIGLANFSELMGDHLFLEALFNTTVIAFGILIIIIPLGMVIAGAHPLPRRHPLRRLLRDHQLHPLRRLAGAGGDGVEMDLRRPPRTAQRLAQPRSASRRRPGCSTPPFRSSASSSCAPGRRSAMRSSSTSSASAACRSSCSRRPSSTAPPGPQAFWYISVPMLKPITLYVSVVTLVSGFNVYAQAYVLASDAQGAPGRQVRVLVLDMLENGFRNYRVGYAASEAMVLLGDRAGADADPVHPAARQGAEMTMSLCQSRADVVGDPPPPPRTRAVNIAIDVLLFVFCLLMILPLVFLVSNAFKTPQEILAWPPTIIPQKPDPRQFLLGADRARRSCAGSATACCSPACRPSPSWRPRRWPATSSPSSPSSRCT